MKEGKGVENVTGCGVPLFVDGSQQFLCPFYAFVGVFASTVHVFSEFGALFASAFLVPSVVVWDVGGH